jgi:hypothetical protein
MPPVPQDIRAWQIGMRFVAFRAGKRTAYATTAAEARTQGDAIYALVPHATRDDKVYVTLVAANPSSGAKQRARSTRYFRRPLSTGDAHAYKTELAEWSRGLAVTDPRHKKQYIADAKRFLRSAKAVRPPLPNPSGHVWRLTFDYGGHEDWPGIAYWTRHFGTTPEVLSVENVTRNPRKRK